MKDYGVLDTSLYINGNKMDGFANGDSDVISMGRLEDSASHEIGIDGEMTVNLSADRSGRVVWRLMQTSDSNKIMSQIINAQENGLFVPVFVQYRDNRGNDLVSGTQGYIIRPADMNRGGKAQSQEWTVIVERLDMAHRGLV